MLGSPKHCADVTGITNFTADNLIVQTFCLMKTRPTVELYFTKCLREGLLNSLHFTN